MVNAETWVMLARMSQIEIGETLKEIAALDLDENPLTTKDLQDVITANYKPEKH